MASPQLNWLIIRNNNSFLKKVRNVKQPFSVEPNNLTNKSSYRYSGLVPRKTVGIEFPPADKKGFIVVTKTAKKQGKPVKTYQKTHMHSVGPRRPLKKLRNTLVKNKYRKDLTKAALVRASVILKSQKTSKKTKGKKSD